MSIEQIYNVVRIDDRLITGGHPTAEQLEALAHAGFTWVINLATYSPGRSLENEAELAAELGMSYTSIPVDWNNPTAADFAAFERAMAERGDAPLFLHCAANFRVTAFYALYARKHMGWTAAQGEALRQQIWAGEDYPVWEAFMARQTAEPDGPGTA